MYPKKKKKEEPNTCIPVSHTLLYHLHPICKWVFSKKKKNLQMGPDRDTKENISVSNLEFLNYKDEKKVKSTVYK
jgi:hypothetical protein